MRLHVVLGSVAIIVAAGCGQSSPDGASSNPDINVSPGYSSDGPTRALSPELPGDDPTFVAAIDAFDPEELEARTMAVSGLVSNDLGGGYFGQKFFMSLWTPVAPDMALRVCHVLVDYANDLDFPATEIVVRQKSYADFEWSQELVAVDASGLCVAVDA